MAAHPRSASETKANTYFIGQLLSIPFDPRARKCSGKTDGADCKNVLLSKCCKLIFSNTSIEGSGRVGEWESGRAGEWESRRKGMTYYLSHSPTLPLSPVTLAVERASGPRGWRAGQVAIRRPGRLWRARKLQFRWSKYH